MLGIKKTRTTPLHPQGDGMVERLNRTLEAQLSKFVEDHQRDWDQHVPLLMMAYRTAEHTTTGCPPAKLIMGHNLRLPIDLLCERPEGESVEHRTSFAEDLHTRLEQVQHFARGHLKVMSDSMKQYYDCCSEGERLEVGEPVWLYNPQRKEGVTPKLARPRHGPYVVVTRLNDLVYRIKPGPKGKAKVVHRNRLWKYRGRDSPTWYAPDNFPTGQEDNITEAQPQDRAPASEVSTAPQHSDAGEEPAPPARRSGRQRQPPDRYQAS